MNNVNEKVKELVVRAENFHGGYDFKQTKALMRALAAALRRAWAERDALKSNLSDLRHDRDNWKRRCDHWAAKHGYLARKVEVPREMQKDPAQRVEISIVEYNGLYRDLKISASKLKAKETEVASLTQEVERLQLELAKVPNLPYKFFPDPLIDENARLSSQLARATETLDRIHELADKHQFDTGAIARSVVQSIRYIIDKWRGAAPNPSEEPKKAKIEVSKVIDAMIASQQSIPPEFQKVIDDNFWRILSIAPPPASKEEPPYGG